MMDYFQAWNEVREMLGAAATALMGILPAAAWAHSRPPKLDPQSQAFLDAIAEQNGPTWEQLGAERGRAAFSSFGDLFGTGPQDLTTREIRIADRCHARLYRPAPTEDLVLPIVIYFHGGGWVLGNLDTHDALCRHIASAAGCALLSVDYRLAPEHPYPAALHDGFDALMHVVQHAREYRVDKDRILVAGDSAGGNLAAALALKARDESDLTLLGQILVYPVIDPGCDTESYLQFAEGYGLRRSDMQWFWKQYLGDSQLTPYAAPLLAESYDRLPPAYVVTAECDVLRDEGERYAERLRVAGVATTLRRHDGMLHGFVHFAGAFDRSQVAVAEIASEIKRFCE